MVETRHGGGTLRFPVSSLRKTKVTYLKKNFIRGGYVPPYMHKVEKLMIRRSPYTEDKHR